VLLSVAYVIKIFLLVFACKLPMCDFIFFFNFSHYAQNMSNHPDCELFPISNNSPKIFGRRRLK